MKSIRVKALGDASVLQYVESEKPSPGAGEVSIRLESIGVNYLDVYHRTGVYDMPLPFTPGTEGAGVIEEVGEGVDGVKTGQRVAWSMVVGSYAEYALVPAAKVVPLPDAIDARTGAATMLQGMTAHYLATSVYPIQRGDSVLVHAAAGGVGGLLVQLAKARGARVFATASTTKLEIAREAGADVVIDYTRDDFEEVVMRETGGKGVNAVYDAVGKTTFDKSLASVAQRGTFALYGQSSGLVPPLDLMRLGKSGLFLTRPSLRHYIATREELLWRAKELFEAIDAGTLRLRIDRELPLAEAAEAHRLLESRQTVGKLLLAP